MKAAFTQAQAGVRRPGRRRRRASRRPRRAFQVEQRRLPPSVFRVRKAASTPDLETRESRCQRSDSRCKSVALRHFYYAAGPRLSPGPDSEIRVFWSHADCQCGEEEGGEGASGHFRQW